MGPPAWGGGGSDGAGVSVSIGCRFIDSNPLVFFCVTFCGRTCWKWSWAPANTFLCITFCGRTCCKWSRAPANKFLRVTFAIL